MNALSSRSYPKTNSLGSAKVDCNTCLRLRQRCDRQRPKCGPCLKEGRNCGGFIVDIVWKNDKHVRRQVTQAAPAAEAANDVERVAEGTRQGAMNQPFRFVQNGSKRRRRTGKQPKAIDQFLTTIQTTSRLCEERSEALDPICISPSTAYGGIATNEEFEEPLETSVDGTLQDSTEDNRDFSRHSSSSSPSSAYDTPHGFFPDLDETILDYNEAYWLEDGSEGAMQVFKHSPAPRQTLNPFPLSLGILSPSPVQKAAAILDMYDQEFCILPLTADCPSNPFRVRKDSCEGSAFLLHAILAISSQHLAKKNNSAILAVEMRNHQATALRLFSEALSYTPASKLLDTLLLLVNFEATQTASSTWAVHLGGAKKLLESMGGVAVCQTGSRARAQVAMLVWWDITLSIISRKQPILPLTYLESLMAYDEEDGWTFFALNGCPADLVMAMGRLAKLASTFEKVLTMEWTTFNTFPVEQIIEQVQNWKNDEDATADIIAHTDDDPESRRNGFHCIEAWRHAILLYAYRVFYRPQTPAGLRSITHLARVVLDHVRCIPDTAIVQKQTLLPVFLAASEVGDDATRAFVRQYCDHWSSTARYSMFGTVATLLERIWADWHFSTRDVYWWGVKVGNNHHRSADGDEGLVAELLLG